jgi:hypothetical protein
MSSVSASQFDPATMFIAYVLRYAADLMEARRYCEPFLAGPQIYARLHEACDNLVTGPAVTLVRRQVGTTQLQNWHAPDKCTVIEVLRVAAVAAVDEPYRALQVTSAEWRKEVARQRLCKAAGLASGTELTIGQLADLLARRISLLSIQNAKLADARHTLPARRLGTAADKVA